MWSWNAGSRGSCAAFVLHGSGVGCRLTHMEYTVRHPQEMENIACEILAALPRGAHEATVLTLSGDLGAGKTTFTQALAKALGIKGRVTSPTFGIMRSYDTADETFTTLIHIDAYRLEGGKDMEALGWNELVSNPKNCIVIEWPGRIADILPKDTVRLSLEYIDETTRRINLKSQAPNHK
jgi:tRNA threonylcarbamoyladenosine biosynthesis protein TsaE